MKYLSILLCLSLCFSAAGQVDVRDFGATGDGVTDDTHAIRRALEASANVHFPAGVYRISDGIQLPPSAQLTGAGSPKLGTFPITDDDKRFFTTPGAPGLPGTTLLFTGAGKARCGTGRDDRFAKNRYALRTSPGLPYSLSDLAIVLDFHFRDAGKPVTRPDADCRANYDVGLFVDDSPGGTVRNVNVFGYWKHAGVAVVSRGHGSNPDYNTFWNCQFSGDVGVALLGQHKNGPGLSGTQFYGCNLFAADHHSRVNGHTGHAAIYIDGDTDSKRAEINGHYFFGGCVRTYSNVAVELDHATNVYFNGVIFEVPAKKNGDISSNRTGRVTGTANTGDVTFSGCRMHDIGLAELGANMTRGQLTVLGNTRDGISLWADSTLLRLTPGADGTDPMIQIARDPKTSNSGWTMRLDRSEKDRLALRYDNQALLSVSTDGVMKTDQIGMNQLQLSRVDQVEIVKGKISAGNRTRLRVAVAKGENGILKSIEAGKEGTLAIVESAAGAVFTIPALGDGNVKIPQPFTFNSPYDRLTLMHTRGEWVEISRSDFPGE